MNPSKEQVLIVGLSASKQVREHLVLSRSSASEPSNGSNRAGQQSHVVQSWSWRFSTRPIDILISKMSETALEKIKRLGQILFPDVCKSPSKGFVDVAMKF